MTTIKDSVHDYIEVQGVARALLDTPTVQRLRRVKQLGTVQYVYPSANHTRFEHSLGVYHLAEQAITHLGLHDREADRVRAAAMLHDVGHAPYSHNIEGLVHRHTGKLHDEVSDLLSAGEVARTLESHALDPEDVASLVRGEGELGQVVAGELDVDRMDYLVRDAHHTGAPYGIIDHERLVRELTFVDGELVLGEGNVQAAESLLLARALMTPTVYNHPVSRIAKHLLRRATEGLVESGDAAAETVRRMDDHDLMCALRESEAADPFVGRLDRRDLYKRAVWAELDGVPAEVIRASHEEVRAFERDIADAADVPEAHVVVDVPSQPSMEESTTRVVVNGEVRPLVEQSRLVDAVRRIQEDQWRLGVYAPDEETDAVGAAAERVLGLDVEALVTEVRTGRHATLDEFR